MLAFGHLRRRARDDTCQIALELNRMMAPSKLLTPPRASPYGCGVNDAPRDFEDRALALARAIYDPLGLQGARMLAGRERDGVFVSDDSVHVFEFTTARDKKKAEKDGQKLVEAIVLLLAEPANQYKAAVGWFVTQHEPEAEQREAIRRIAQREGRTLNCVSYVTLRKRVCDVEGYLAARGDAPFGSIAYTSAPDGQGVPPVFIEDGASSSVSDVSERLVRGDRIVLTGEFGVGKSYAAREIYRDLRKRHFKKPAESPFPIHVNLRDCAGLRTPAEILRRHAEEIGFSGERGLISAWRAGSCVLLLDGFDEVIPSRWLGTAANLRTVRWEALSPVRRLVQEAPAGTGVLVAGRGHYFASASEMIECLGVSAGITMRLEDFDEDQARTFLAGHGLAAVIPDWLPTRPLLLSHLLVRGLLAEVASLSSDIDPPQAWRTLLDMICEREAHIYKSVPPSTIRDVLRRLATTAKGHDDDLGRLSVEDLEQVFYEVSGRKTDEEVLQLLQRLPGLALATSEDEEFRLFADQGVASTAYGEDLAAYLVSPYQGHPLCETATWSQSCDTLAVEVCALDLAENRITSSQVIAACDFRSSRNQQDVILLDSIRVADELGLTKAPGGYLVEGILARELAVSPERHALGTTHLRDSVIEVLDLTYLNEECCPTFERCLISEVEGLAHLPANLANRFPLTEVERFVGPDAATTNNILSLDMALDDRVALSILHKVYAKRGSGRKDSALPRGLDAAARERVPDVVEELTTRGLVVASSRGNVTIYRPVKGRGPEVAEYLATPSSFRLKDLP
jgi:hypothetical protein